MRLILTRFLFLFFYLTSSDLQIFILIIDLLVQYYDRCYRSSRVRAVEIEQYFFLRPLPNPRSRTHDSLKTHLQCYQFIPRPAKRSGGSRVSRVDWRRWCGGDLLRTILWQASARWNRSAERCCWSRVAYCDHYSCSRVRWGTTSCSKGFLKL